jgi:hypothetical protein
MRYLLILVAVATLATVPAAHGATACPGTKQGKVQLTKIRASNVNCTTVTKVAKSWAKLAEKGHCVPPNIRSTAKCSVSGYRCTVKADSGIAGPRELPTCRRGTRKATWVGIFS